MNSDSSASQQSTILILAIIMIILCSCIAFLSGLGMGFGLNETINSPESISDEQAGPNSGGASIEAGQLLFEDDFSRNRWEVYEDGDHSKGYSDGRYFIRVDVANFDYWSTAQRNFDDFALEVETTQTGGPNDNNYGLILRHQDDSNFYRFEISGDGFYSFGKVVDDEFYDIVSWQESAIIKQGKQLNSLRIEAVGPKFTFFINGELIDTAVDDDFGRGDIGFLVGTYEEAGAHISFDNLNVWAIK